MNNLFFNSCKIVLCGSFIYGPVFSHINQEFKFSNIPIKNYQNKINIKRSTNLKLAKFNDEIYKNINFSKLDLIIEKNNLLLASERKKLDQSKNNLSITYSKYKPNVGLSADGLPKFSVGEGNNPKNETKELKASLSATINYKLYDPVKSSSIDIAKNEIYLSEIKYKILKNKILSEAQRKYIDLQLANEKVKIASNAVRLSESSLVDAKKLNKALILSDVEVLEAESQLSRDQQFLQEKDSELEIAIISLSEILGINKTFIKNIITKNQIVGVWEMDISDSIRFAKSNSNEIRKLKKDLQISKKKNDRELSKSKPSFNLTNKISSSLNQGQRRVSNINFDNNGSEYENVIGLNAKWNFYNGGKNKFIRKFNKNIEKEFDYKIKDTENKIKAKVLEHFESYKSSFANIISSLNLVKKNKKILKISRLRFNAGVASQREIINNQRDLTQAKIFHANSISTYNRRLIDLKEITNINNLRICTNQDNQKIKVNNPINDLEFKNACNINIFDEDDFVIKTNDFKIYKNSLDKRINYKDEEIKLKNTEDLIKDSDKNKDLIKSKDKSFINSDYCQDLNDIELQRICFDSYL